MTTNTFESWFETQLANGLFDIKFAVTPGKGASASAVKGELLAAEALIEGGYLKAQPKAVSAIPADIELLMSECKTA